MTRQLSVNSRPRTAAVRSTSSTPPGSRDSRRRIAAPTPGGIVASGLPPCHRRAVCST
ncbi:hypothetical protein ACFQQB_66125 [Nonomuraea rubra]|uniref:hypothetical protein n=1 Tax=Nonomuraea rubra TaxID=46180 RepID=UPI0031E723DF